MAYHKLIWVGMQSYKNKLKVQFCCDFPQLKSKNNLKQELCIPGLASLLAVVINLFLR